MLCCKVIRNSLLPVSSVPYPTPFFSPERRWPSRWGPPLCLYLARTALIRISRRFGGATKPNLFSSRSSDCFFPCLCFGYERQGTMTREKRGLDAGDGDSLHPEPKRPKVPALAR
ncbi:hypothetical protein BHE74_00020056 [Ensete ventricosum]|nr:hypothetical protein BHE74_00020056 [Ensete ventricosum]